MEEAYFLSSLGGWVLPSSCKCGGDIIVFTDGRYVTDNNCLECLGRIVLPEEICSVL